MFARAGTTFVERLMELRLGGPRNAERRTVVRFPVAEVVSPLRFAIQVTSRAASGGGSHSPRSNSAARSAEQNTDQKTSLRSSTDHRAIENTMRTAHRRLLQPLLACCSTRRDSEHRGACAPRHHGFNERIVSHDPIFRTETPSLFATIATRAAMVSR